MKNSKRVRLILFAVVFVLVVILPWWASVVVLAGLTIYLPFYLEMIFFGFLFDILYHSRYDFPYTGLFLSLVFLIVVMFIKTKIRT